MTCPRCRRRAKFVAYRRKTVGSLLGRVIYERPYYHGCGCPGGWCPTDDELRLTERLTPAAAEVAALHGLLQSFDEAAAKSLPKSAGLRISAATVRRTTERFGADLRARRERGETFGRSAAWDWRADATGKRCAYVSLDATGVRQQGDGGAAAEGRLPYVGEVFNPTPAHRRRRGRAQPARYLSGLLSLPEIGRQIRREAQAAGIARADVLIGLTDGGNGLEECLRDHVFSGLGRPMQFILDFYHAAEHLHEFAAVLHAGCEERIAEQADRWCHALKHRGGAALLGELEGLDLSQASPAVIEAHRLLSGYVRSNQHRMDYPTYTARGWLIGSGSIESACKNVINARLNGTGMRWSEHGTDELAHARALYKSEPSAWDDYWSRAPAHAA